VPLPKLVSPVEGITVRYQSDKFLAPQEFPRLAAFLDRHLAEPFWYAPQDAVKDGKPVPLSHEASSWLVRNLTGKPSLKISSLNKGAKQNIAWRWLIISYNHLHYHQADRVDLPRSLSVFYERRKGGKPPAAAPQVVQDPKELVNGMIEAFKESLKSNQPSTKVQEPGLITLREDDLLSFLGNTKELMERIALSIGLEPAGSQGKGPYYKVLPEALELIPGLPKVAQAMGEWIRTSDCLYDGAEVTRVTQDIDTNILDLFRDSVRGKEDPGNASGGVEEEPSEFSCASCGGKLQELSSHCPCGEAERSRGSWPSWPGFPESGNQKAEKGEVLACSEPPESFDTDGLQWFREDIDILDIYNGQTYLTRELHGVTYVAIAGSPQGAAPPKSEKSKGKVPVRVFPPVSKPPANPAVGGPSKPSSPKEKKGKKAKAGMGPNGAKSVPGSPLEEENPLRVKGEPKSKALTDEQRGSLRKFFKLKDEQVPAVAWQVMDSKQRAAAMKERSIPRWATTAVLSRPSSLAEILSGKLTSENFGSMLKASPSNRTGSAQASEAWVRLKSRFEGTTLYRNPVTSKEKALKKAFDSMVSDYGDQKCFPKPKEHPGRQGRQASPARSARDGGGMSELTSMMRIMGEFARAFRS